MQFQYSLYKLLFLLFILIEHNFIYSASLYLLWIIILLFCLASKALQEYVYRSKKRTYFLVFFCHLYTTATYESSYSDSYSDIMQKKLIKLSESYGCINCTRHFEHMDAVFQFMSLCLIIETTFAEWQSYSVQQQVRIQEYASKRKSDLQRKQTP